MTDAPQDTFIATEHPMTKEGSVLIVTADDVQDLEFFYPYYRLVEEGYRVHVATPKGGAFKGKMGMGLKESLALAEVHPEKYDLLYLPGGKAPAALMKNNYALDIARHFADGGKPIAAICHGPQILAAAAVISRRRIAAWPDVETEIRAAGASYVNEATVVDGQFITARWPGDLPSHLAATIKALEQCVKNKKTGMHRVA